MFCLQISSLLSPIFEFRRLILERFLLKARKWEMWRFLCEWIFLVQCCDVLRVNAVFVLQVRRWSSSASGREYWKTPFKDTTPASLPTDRQVELLCALLWQWHPLTIEFTHQGFPLFNLDLQQTWISPKHVQITFHRKKMKKIHSNIMTINAHLSPQILIGEICPDVFSYYSQR